MYGIPELDMPLAELREDLGKALSEGGSQPLLRLTDEEIAVLDPTGTADSIIPAPHLAGLTGAERETVLATALRSLVSREVVEVADIAALDTLIRSGSAPGTEPEDVAGGERAGAGVDEPVVDLDLRISPEVDLALTLRRTADRVLAVEQTTAAGTAYAYVHVHAPDLMLIERVTGGGLHLFGLAASAADAAAVLQPLVDPFGVADRDGSTLRLDPDRLSPDELGPPLGPVIDNSLAVGRLSLLAEPPGPMLLTYATDHELWTVRVDAPHAPSGVVAHAVGPRTLLAELTRLLQVIPA